MNNRSLTNLKFAWEVPGQGKFRIDTSLILRPDILKPLGWHTASRVYARRIVAVIRAKGPSPALLEAFRYSVNNRHNVPKGWHI